MKTIDYENACSNIAERLAARETIVVATSEGGRVTARTVYCVSSGVDVLFITSKAYTKYKQILSNPRVALCFDNVQIEAFARVLGHPTEEGNAAILNSCKQINARFMAAAKYKNSVLIRAETALVEMWVNNGREYTDINKRTSWRVG